MDKSGFLAQELGSYFSFGVPLSFFLCCLLFLGFQLFMLYPTRFMLRAALFLKFDSVPQESFEFPLVCYNMVLSDIQIADIIKLHRQNKSPDDIAAAVGCRRSSVYNHLRSNYHTKADRVRAPDMKDEAHQAANRRKPELTEATSSEDAVVQVGKIIAQNPKI